MRLAIIAIALMSVLGCGSKKQPTDKPGAPNAPAVLNIAMENASTNSLNAVEIEWKGPNVSGGIVMAGTAATILDVEWPSVPSATLSFIDYKTRTPYKIAISLAAANEQVNAGGIQKVTFRILSYDKAVVVCE